jgi:hypothetical protein
VRGPVLLEGPDGGGKTTLAEAVAAAMGYHVAKNVAPEPGTSEMVYGRRFRGEPLLEPKDAAWLTKVLVAEGGVMVLCVPPVGACVAAWRERRSQWGADTKDDPVKEEQLRAVHEDYRRVALFSTGPNAYHYDRTAPGALDRMVATLKERLDP